MCHDLLLTVLCQCFQNYADIRVARLGSKYGHAAHAIQGFENDIFVVLMKGPESTHIATDQYGGTTLREVRCKHFFVEIAQTLRSVYYQGTLCFCAFQNVGAIKKLIVKGRVFTHQNNVQVAQIAVLFGS